MDTSWFYEAVKSYSHIVSSDKLPKHVARCDFYHAIQMPAHRPVGKFMVVQESFTPSCLDIPCQWFMYLSALTNLQHEEISSHAKENW